MTNDEVRAGREGGPRVAHARKAKEENPAWACLRTPYAASSFVIRHSFGIRH